MSFEVLAVQPGWDLHCPFWIAGQNCTSDWFQVISTWWHPHHCLPASIWGPQAEGFPLEKIAANARIMLETVSKHVLSLQPENKCGPVNHSEAIGSVGATFNWVYISESMNLCQYTSINLFYTFFNVISLLLNICQARTRHFHARCVPWRIRRLSHPFSRALMTIQAA